MAAFEVPFVPTADDDIPTAPVPMDDDRKKRMDLAAVMGNPTAPLGLPPAQIGENIRRMGQYPSSTVVDPGPVPMPSPVPAAASPIPAAAGRESVADFRKRLGVTAPEPTGLLGSIGYAVAPSPMPMPAAPTMATGPASVDTPQEPATAFGPPSPPPVPQQPATAFGPPNPMDALRAPIKAGGDIAQIRANLDAMEKMRDAAATSAAGGKMPDAKYYQGLGMLGMSPEQQNALARRFEEVDTKKNEESLAQGKKETGESNVHSIDHYLEQMGYGGDNKNFVPLEHKLAAMSMQRQDAGDAMKERIGTTQAAQHADLLKQIEAMKTTSAEKIAGQHYSPEAREESEAKAHLAHADQVYEQNHRVTQSPEQAEVARGVFLEGKNRDKITGKLKKEASVEQTKTGLSDTAKDMANKALSASKQVDDKGMPTGNLSPDALIDQVDKLSGDPNGMRALAKKVINTPGWEEKILKPLSEKVGSHALNYQSSDASLRDSFDHRGYSVKSDPSTLAGRAHMFQATAMPRAMEWATRQFLPEGESGRTTVSSMLENIGRTLTPGTVNRTITLPNGQKYSIPDVPTLAGRGLNQTNEEHEQVGKKLSKGMDLIDAILAEMDKSKNQ